MKIGWVLGWAVPEAWFAPLAQAAFPRASHSFVGATPEALSQLETIGPFDWVAGYSLGSSLLLSDPARSVKLGRVALLAPIFTFPSEANSGGRMARVQVKFLARWLRRERAAALTDFYVRAGLDVAPTLAESLSAETLTWGLAQLETLTLPPVLPIGWRAWCGADDALLDATCLHALAPDITIVPAATHHPAALLQAFATEVLCR
jgi:hypothetical protein